MFLGKSGIFLFQKELNPGGGADDETIDVDVSKSLRVEINIPSAFFFLEILSLTTLSILKVWP